MYVAAGVVQRGPAPAWADGPLPGSALTERAGIVDRLRVRSALKQFYQAAYTRYSCTPEGLK